MQSPLTITITFDSLVEFEEDAAAFAQGEPEFVNGTASIASSSVPAGTTPSPSLDTSNPQPEA
jgi:hypothetical protein